MTTSAYADNLSNDECREISEDYDSWIEVKEVAEAMLSTCEVAGLSICTRTEITDLKKRSANATNQAAIQRERLIRDCPSWAQGL